MTGLLLALVLFLLVFAIAQIIRIYELSVKASNRDEYVVTNKDNSNQGRLMLVFGIALLSSFVAMVVVWNPLALPKPSSLHMILKQFYLSHALKSFVSLYNQPHFCFLV